MIIDQNNPRVIELIQAWNATSTRSGELCEEFQERLTRQVIVPAVQECTGELILKYHEFLTMVPSGAHSFAHGSQMVSKTVYWVSVGRIASGDRIEIPKIVHPPRGPVGGPKLTFVTPKKFIVLVHWSEYLKPQYKNSSQPSHFVVDQNQKKVDEFMFDVSFFGEDLFFLREDRFAWATKDAIVVGNASVLEWMKKLNSEKTYTQLMNK